MPVLRVIAVTPFLDEGGRVYVTGSRARECLRLNRSASTLWRSLLSTGIDREHLGDDERSLVESLCAIGAIRLVEGSLL